jgi:TonB-dependent receptor
MSMNLRSIGRHTLRAVVLSSCAYLSSSQAMAQSTPAPKKDEEKIEEIVVRGINLQRQLAVQAKRDAEAILDAVSADDLGRLPDRNTAEALARLPGVSITQDQGEGRYVSIRGASPNLNAITINGLAIGTVEENSRQVPLDILGGELLGGLSVVKAVTPDLEANAIGGYIDVKTLSPFDFNGPYFGRATAQVGDDEYSGFNPYSGNLLVGGKFGSDESIGVLLGASYTDRHYLTKGLYVDDWRPVPGLTRGAPESHKFNDYDLDRKRKSFTGALEFKPDADSLYYARVIWTEAEESEFRYRNRNYFGRVITPATRFAISPGMQSGAYANQRLRIELRAEDKLRRIGNFAIGGENTFDNLEVKYAASLIDNRMTEPNQNWVFQSGDVFSGSFDLEPEYFRVTPDVNAIVRGVGTIGLNSYSTQVLEDNDEGAQGKVDVKYNLDLAETEGYLKAGALFRTVKKSQNFDANNYLPGSGGVGAFNAGLPGILSNIPLEGAVKGQFYQVGPRINFTGINQFTAANINNATALRRDAAASLSGSTVSDFTTEEDILSAYVMGSFTFDQFTFIGGGRLEQTKISGESFDLVNGTTVRSVSRDGKYTNFMPNLHLRYGDKNAPVVLRAAWTNTIGRPEYTDITARRVLTQTPTTGGRFDGSLSQGNPDLQSFESMNFDLSAEYYFDNSGILSAGAFYKDIDNFIFNEVITQTNVTFEGQTYDRLVTTTPRNAEKGKIKGVEFNYQQQFAFLPAPFDGFGGGASLTLVDSSIRAPGRTDKLPFVRQADRVYSLTGFYQIGPFEAVLSYDWSDDILVQVGGNVNGDFYDKDYGRLDLRTSYSVTDNVSVFLDVLNINNAPLGEFQTVEAQITRREVYGRSAFVGATVKW